MHIDDGELTAGVTLRLLAAEDAQALAAAYAANRAHLAPWEPVRPEAFFTPEGQRQRIQELLRRHAEDSLVPWVFEEADGRIVGAITLTGISRGPFCSAHLGYWVDAGRQGRGLAGAAVARVCRFARDTAGLHRIEASTLLENTGSQRVLAKSGFDRIGTAPRYLHINGRWRDCHLYQRVLHDSDPVL